MTTVRALSMIISELIASFLKPRREKFQNGVHMTQALETLGNVFPVFVVCLPVVTAFG